MVSFLSDPSGTPSIDRELSVRLKADDASLHHAKESRFGGASIDSTKEVTSCPKKQPNITNGPRSIIPTLHVTTPKRPNITRLVSMKRRRIMPIRLAPMTVMLGMRPGKRKKPTPKNTARSEMMSAV